MSRRRIVALVGLSGVGKSTALSRARAFLPFEHFRASALINSERERRQEMAIEHDALRKANIEDNQALLVEGFRHEAPKTGLVILDGHTIIDTPNGIVEIAPNLFRMLGISRLVVMTEEPNEIYRRRSADLSRKRPIRSVDELRQQQDRCVLVAYRTALELRIPLIVVVSEEVQDLVYALRKS